MKKTQVLFYSLLVCVLSGCVKEPEEQHTSFETVTLKRENVTAPVSWSAAIRGTGDVSIVSRCTGTLNAIKVKDGQRVKKGDVLARLDPRDFRTRLEQAQGVLAQARAQYSDAAANFKRYEDSSLEYSGIKMHADDEDVGLFSTVISREDYENINGYQSLKVAFSRLFSGLS